MKRITMTLMALLTGLTLLAATRTATLRIDSRVKYQHVTGFGGFSPSPQWAYWLNDTEMNKLFGKKDNQLGLNIVRLYIANSKNAWASSVANAKAAQRNGAFIFASPWSPPASWKSNNSDSNGGKLLESHYKDWALFLNDYYKYMKSQGVTIDAISIQNEPDWNASYQSCIWTGDELAKFLRLYGHLIECKIIAPEAIHFTRSMHEPILNDPEACAQLDILGGHFYGWDGSSYPLAAQKGKEVWMTEFLINERQQNENKNINWRDDGFLFARSINDAMLANMSAWVHYSLKRYYGCLGDGMYGTTDNAITKRGYILSHYAKYVSGTTRVRHALDESTGRLSSSAYLSVTGDSLIVMLLNPTSDDFTTTISLPFNTRAGRQIVTTESANMQSSDFTSEAETATPTVAIAPYSVNTLIYTKSSALTDDTDEGGADRGDCLFSDDFDLYGSSCIPPGWCSKSEEGLRHAGSYAMGPRIMSFSAEGAMQHAFYFRTDNTSSGYIDYGEESDYRLTLQPGQYTLSYSVVGWKALPLVTGIVAKASGGNVKTLSSKPTSYVSENGASSRITKTTDFDLDFEITEAGNYLLRWGISKSTGGLNEALVGNIRLTRHADSGTEHLQSPVATPSPVVGIYDLQGRQIRQLQKGMNVIREADGSAHIAVQR